MTDAPSRRAASEKSPLPQPTSRRLRPSNLSTSSSFVRESSAARTRDSSTTSRKLLQFLPNSNCFVWRALCITIAERCEQKTQIFSGRLICGFADYLNLISSQPKEGYESSTILFGRPDGSNQL